MELWKNLKRGMAFWILLVVSGIAFGIFGFASFLTAILTMNVVGIAAYGAVVVLMFPISIWLTGYGVTWIAKNVN